ncbi:hypothetical protein GGQ80_000126 [Sphingomonas jinjuensis]|uniref:Uncharacterized protein n=1 Tax=Sphingomonas jinjuensis TaxID=535907 RepID=A0A840F344_9SPHN|nr:hypothetical protein [Sphingomonas jinjuensis]MBB4152250.1 hypothetical protein [Sphingomonas jinjuensis]
MKPANDAPPPIGTAETNNLVSQPGYWQGMPNDQPMRGAAFPDQATPRTLPARYYRSISLAAWGGVIALGVLSWVAIFHLF